MKNFLFGFIMGLIAYGILALIFFGIAYLTIENPEPFFFFCVAIALIGSIHTGILAYICSK